MFLKKFECDLKKRKKMLFHEYDDDDVFNVLVCDGKLIIMYIKIYYK